MISTPSYPASRASMAERTKSRMVLSTPLAPNFRGLNLEMGDLMAEGATQNGVYA